jgi:hypothetical protein
MLRTISLDRLVAFGLGEGGLGVLTVAGGPQLQNQAILD